MITQCIASAMAKAEYKILDGGEGFYGSIPGFPGLWAEGTTLEECRQELQSSLEGWLLLSTDRRDQRLELLKSLENPHPESREFAELGFDAWAAGLPQEDCELLYDPSLATPVRWIAGKGWVEGDFS